MTAQDDLKGPPSPLTGLRTPRCSLPPCLPPSPALCLSCLPLLPQRSSAPAPPTATSVTRKRHMMVTTPSLKRTMRTVRRRRHMRSPSPSTTSPHHHLQAHQVSSSSTLLRYSTTGQATIKITVIITSAPVAALCMCQSPSAQPCAFACINAFPVFALC
jgi:hypothetical protein